VNPLYKSRVALLRAGRAFRRAGIRGIYRAIRYGAPGVVFDLYHNVDTDAVSTRYTWPEEYKDGWDYFPATLADLKRVLRRLRGIRPENFVFFDVGSGKGRTLLVASRLPFKQIIGIEISPELHASGVANLSKFRSGKRKRLNIVTYCADATSFPFPPDNTVFFLNNPFKAPVMERFLAHLRASLLEHPREVYIFYLKPVYHEMVASTGWLEPVETSNQLVVYRYLESEIFGSAKAQAHAAESGT